MDPFVQRMVARAHARREKLDSQLMNAGLEATKQRNPLQDYNQTQLQRVTREVEVTTVAKSGAESIASSVNVTPTKVESVTTHSKEGEEDAPKENVKMGITEIKQECTSFIRDSTRSGLLRLGALYSDTQLSSPIHKTEESFSAEQDEREDEDVPQQTHLLGTGLVRLAMLADKFKHWEDDLNHPTAAISHDRLNQSKGSTVSDVHRSIGTEGTWSSKTLSKPNPDQQCFKVTQKVAEAKKFVLDESIIATLGDGNDDLSSLKTHNIAATALSNKIENKLTTIQENASVTKLLESVQESQSPSKRTNNPHSSSCNKLISSPGKINILSKSAGSPRIPGVPQMGLRVGSPHKDLSPKTGSVLHKAALFESSPTKKNSKDPAELSVSERLALFERNKGQALIPKAAFSMSVPAKYLAGSNDEKKLSSKVMSPGNRNRMVDSVVTQLQGSITTCDKPQKVMPSGKGSSHTLMQAHKLNVAEVAPPPPAATEDLPARSSKALAQMFERGNAMAAGNDIIKSVQSEREKEIQMLLNRWSKNKQLASLGACNMNVDNESNRTAVPDIEADQESSKPPHPPPLPPDADLSPVQLNKRVAGFSPSKTSKDPLKQSPLKNLNVPKSPSPEKRHKAQNLSQQYTELTDVKRIKVSPPKPGHLYPCLSDIEVTTEAGSEVPDDRSISDDMDSSGGENLGDTSFGREILMAAGMHRSPNTLNRGQMAQTDSSDDESAVLEEIDDFLDEALGDDSDSEASPSPPKKTRDDYQSPQRGCSDQGKKQPYSSPTTSQSHSFKYLKGDEPEPDITPRKAEHIPSFVLEGNEQVPLMHTVSFYRRQQNMAVKGTPVRQILRQPQPEPGKIFSKVQVEPDEGSVRNKISQLVDEVSKQQTVISQASQALNLCCSTVEFSGSAEQVEGERLLLVATHRRQAALHETQRLKVEGSLKPGGHSSELTERGSLVITNITLPLKKDYLRTMVADERCLYFVCLARAQEQVVATPVLAASSENLRRGGGAALVFPGSLRLDGLYSDFKVTLEIYNLHSNKEVLPHDIKYHIAGKKDGNGNKLRLTPKKLLKQESRLVMPSIQSPAGPSAVRSSAFQMSGYVVFSLRELRRNQFTLNKVAYSSPLEGNIQLQLKSELELDVGKSGFLTMFEDVSGFGAWHRRWCLLEGSTLSYWKYPDDEKKKVPIGQIDLNICTTESVGLVSRYICARPHTFLLETTRPLRPEDEDSLVLVRHGTRTIIRHLLSADTLDDRLLWCAQLNKTLAMLRAWGNKASIL